MKNVLSSLFVCGLLMLSSCSTVYKTATVTEVGNNVQTYPEVADLDIQPKVTGMETWSFKPFHIGEPKLSTVKGNLIAETLKKYKADIMLEPQFMFQRTAYGERVLTVTGFPATFKNFRKATKSDLEAIKACRQPNLSKKYNEGNGKLFGVFKK